MMPITFCFLLFFTQCFLASATAVVSYCLLPNGETLFGLAENCDGGDIFLRSKYLNVAINNAGSLGSSETFHSSYYTGRSGILADFDKNGFTSTESPAFSAPLERSLEGCKLTTLLLDCVLKLHFVIHI